MKRVEEIVALRDVLLTRRRMPDSVSPDYAVRAIMRAYSKKFHTPLHEVCELPIEFVLRAYYEEVFEELEDKDLEETARELGMTEEEERAERARKDVEEVEVFRDLEDERRGQQAAKKIEEVAQHLSKTATIMREMISKQGSEAELPDLRTSEKPLPERITMRFEPDLDVDNIDSFGLLEDPIKKKQS
jgi:hypothetical protein